MIIRAMYKKQESKGPPLQGEDDIVIRAAPEKVWAVLEDSSLLPAWNSGVSHATPQKESPGTVRTCAVSMAGKSGEVTERCVEAVHQKRIAWRLEADTMGIGKMFSGLTMAIALNPQSDGSTRVRASNYYTPRNLMATVMNAMMMRSKIGQKRQEILRDLKKFVER